MTPVRPLEALPPFAAVAVIAILERAEFSGLNTILWGLLVTIIVHYTPKPYSNY